eukprot:COSAG02_NODE_8_length_60691_cov_104.994752_16_plen_79_part_00
MRELGDRGDHVLISGFGDRGDPSDRMEDCWLIAWRIAWRVVGFPLDKALMPGVTLRPIAHTCGPRVQLYMYRATGDTM